MSTAKPGGRLAVVESFLGPVDQGLSDEIADTQGAIVDLHMFIAVGGRERPVSQYEDLLQQKIYR
jgi:hypothetical protein